MTSAPRRPFFREETWPFLILFAAVFIARVWTAASTDGTNDLVEIYQYCEVFREGHPILEIHRHMKTNHGLGALVLIQALAALPFEREGFGFAYRFAMISADSLALVFIWKLLRLYAVPRAKLIFAAAILNPVNFLVASFHGNNDALVMLLMIASIYALERRRGAVSGLLYAAAVGVKIAPLVFAPAYVYFLLRGRDLRLAGRFFAAAAAGAAVFYAPLFLSDPKGVLDYVFSYNALMGQWGFGGWIADVKGPPELFEWHIRWARLIFLGASAGALAALWNTKLNLVEACFATLAVFFFVTHGFGLQYLIWFSQIALIAFPAYGAGFGLSAGLFMFRVYGNWSDWQAPWFADSWSHFHWAGLEAWMARILWASTAVFLAVWARRRLR